jgi:replicative DNA helicase
MKNRMMKNDGPPAPTLLGDTATDLLGQEPQQYVPTGLQALDDLLVGVVHGEVTLIAARPSMGKTSLAMTILENAASTGLMVGILSMEMGKRALAMRRLSGLAGVPISALRKNELNKRQQAQVAEAAKTLKALPLYVDDRGGLTGDQAYDTLKAWHDMGISLVALDYIQLMRGTNESRQVQVGECIRAVKNAAVAFDMPLLVLSQVSRASSIREDKEPRLSDLRDSGELEQVADTVLMLHYPNEDDKDEPERICECFVRKQRNGPTGVASLKFLQSETRFTDV